MPNPSHRPNGSTARSRVLLLPAITLALAACGGATATPSPSPSGGPTGSARPTPTAVPGDPGDGLGGSGGITDPGTGGGGSGGSTGGGIVFPIPGGGDPNQNPLFGQATYVTPAKDLQGQHPVNVQLVRALQQDDGSIVADLRWWSGVAPCSQLDHVEIAKDDAARTIRFTVIEGSGKGDVACIDIAQLSATTVDLGTLTAGEWTLSAAGDAPQITLDVR